MTTAIPRPLTEQELEERTQSAWAAYSDGLQGLAGREYDEAEGEAWDRLQRELREIDEARAAPVA